MKKLTVQDFIEKARVIHGNKFDYSEVDYINNCTKVKIKCHQHGIFEQMPSSHLSRIGCPSCSGNLKSNTQDFIEKARVIHGDKYDYSEVDYINNNTKVKIKCHQHGVFEQTPGNHLSRQGCPKCMRNEKSNTQEFIEKARVIHNNKFDYHEVDYINNCTKVKIKCHQHGIFEQTPGNHLFGQGCSKCSKEISQYNRYKNKTTTLYYIKIGDFFKIGLTQTNIEKRFKKEIESGLHIEVIKTLEFKDGYEALLLEQKILHETLATQVSKDESPIEGGWTEVRYTNILDIIEKTYQVHHNSQTPQQSTHNIT